MTDKMEGAAPGGHGDGAENAHTQQGGGEPHVDSLSPADSEASKKRVHSLTDLASVRSYLARIGADPTSLCRAAVRVSEGQYQRDLHSIQFLSEGDVIAKEHLRPTEAEQAAIKAEWAAVEWPKVLPIENLVSLPQELRAAEREGRLYVFRDRAGMVVMVQERCPEGWRSKYRPWSYWDDKTWRQCEPGGPLPIYNAHRLKDNFKAFIHEGAKAAAHVQWMVDGETRAAREALAAHPWGELLRHGVHLGWIGGALNPSRTDWSVLNYSGIEEVVVIADNDKPGKRAVPGISERLNMTVEAIVFDGNFPEHFDLGDPFPDNLFEERNGDRVYVGPSMAKCTQPATWATTLIPNPKGKPTPVLRDVFAEDWYKVVWPPVYVHWKQRDQLLGAEAFKRKVASFTHANDTAKLLDARFERQVDLVDYRPDVAGEIVNTDGGQALNVHRPSTIKPKAGDLTLWHEFLGHLFPEERDRWLAERWIATLIARPEVRMTYSMLLVSEAQGVGKTSLAEKVLRPLVGDHNTSVPAAADVIKPTFNDWMANKRLVVVNEIYAGNDSRPYDKLKSVVADDIVTVEQKYLPSFKVQNWCHVVASSNSFRCLKLVEGDRRWLVPEVNERHKPHHFWKAFNEWLVTGGLEAIAAWAREYGDYVQKGEHAPDTRCKQQMVDENMTPGQEMVRDMAEDMAARDDRVVLAMGEVERWVKSQRAQDKQIEGPDKLRSAMKTVPGIWICRHGQRPKIGGKRQYVVANFDPDVLLTAGETVLRQEHVKCYLRNPDDVTEAEL
jgi:hypothetical protein